VYLIVLCYCNSRKRMLGRESSLTHLQAFFFFFLETLTTKSYLTLYSRHDWWICRYIRLPGKLFRWYETGYSLRVRPHIPAHTNLLPHESHHKTCTCLSSYWTNEEMSADGIQIRPLRHSSFSAARQFFNSWTWA